jgi:hypothetical protein
MLTRRPDDVILGEPALPHRSAPSDELITNGVASGNQV